MTKSELEDPVAQLDGSVESLLADRGRGGAGGGDQADPAGRSVRQDVVMRVPVTVQVVLGKVKLPVAELMKLSQGAVVALDRSLGDPVDLLVNGFPIARGEIVVVDKETKRLGISLTEIDDNLGAG